MSTLWISGAAAVVLAGQPLPDQLDILRGADTTPQIQLLLDSSCSMGWSAAPSICTYYPTAQSNLLGSYQSGSTWYLSRTDQLKAALTGCRANDDGILDAWASRVLFSIREFGGSRRGLLSPFDPTLTNQAALESAVLNLPASGGTPLAPAYQLAARNFDTFFSDSNTKRCRQNYIVVMSDGVGNSSDNVLFDFVPGNADITVRDANYCFGSSGSSCPAPPYLDEAARYLLETDTGQTSDVLSLVDGDQPIRTYTIGFQAPSAANALLEAMAIRGDGLSYSTTSYEQLSTAFEEIISSIVERARVNFNSGSVEADGLFSGNHLYLSMFRPVENGHWLGTTKKFCVIPGGSNSDCLFERRGTSDELFVNPEPKDVWTGSSAEEANVGGTGQVMLTQTFGVPSVTTSPPANPLGRRKILTWRPGQSGYVPVTSSGLSNTDTWTSHPCDHHSLLNNLHGFSEDVDDCAAGDYSPIGFDSWPIGDTVHGGTILLQYTPECESSGDRCYAVTVANDGMLHFYDAVTGVETSAVIPGELWRPNTIAHHRLDDRGDQPSADITRRYYFDGQLSLHHIDEDGDGVIEAGEEAQLIAGLGRGGRGYYLFDVLDFDGVPDSTRNPPRPLLADETTGFRNLMDTWSAPWTGTMEITAGLQRTVAVFPSGHVPELDAVDAALGVLPPAAPRDSNSNESRPTTVTCADLGIPDELCSTPDPASFCPLFGLTCAPGACSPCPFVDVADCNNAGHVEPFCYDWPGLSTLPPGLGVWAQSPIDLVGGPYTYEDGGRQAMAYRVRFSRFELQPGDYVSFTDPRGTEVARLSGSSTATATPWIYDTSFTMHLVTNGANDVAALGYTISGIDTILGPTPVSGELHRPSLFVVDLARWNEGQDLSAPYAGSDPGVFVSAPVGGDARQAKALRFRITSDCDGTTGPDEVCVDQNTNANTRDLRWMMCPITAEPTVYTEGGLLRTIYLGDECGQIWAAEYDINDEWSVRRLLRLNASDGDGFTVRGESSRDYRKIFTKLELVVSACPGTRARGIYFGSGNIQRPAATDNLTDPDVSDFSGSAHSPGREVVGVVWDTPLLGSGASLDDLTNVTDQVSVGDPTASGNQAGWFIELDEDERMLRDPLVFDGVAYFDVYRPLQAATECISASGESRTLFMDNCTAEPLDTSGGGTPDEQRTTAVRTDSTIGGGFLVLTPQGETPIVTLGQNGDGAAALPGHGNRKSLRLFLWRP